MFRGLTRFEQRAVVAMIVMLFITWQIGARIREHRNTREYPITGHALVHPRGSLVLNPDVELPPASSLEAALMTGAIDINRADADLLEVLPGIGPTRARSIVHNRQTHGPFESVDDLERVAGIGPKTLESLRPYVTVAELTPEQRAQLQVGSLIDPHFIASDELPEPRRAADESRPAMPVARVNINTASAEELEVLHGVGPALSQRIVDDRNSHGPFRTVDDLTRVRGIGPVILEQNRHLLAVR